MSPRSLRRPGLRAVLAFAALLGQIFAPAIHEVGESLAEAAYHGRHLSFVGARLTRDTAPHHHHDENDCALCAAARYRTPSNPVPRALVQNPARFAALIVLPSARAISPVLAASPSRGPPLA